MPPEPTVPFFFQLSVQPTEAHPNRKNIYAGYATIVVFAKSGEKAREMMGRHVAQENWQITEVKRIQLLGQKEIANMPVEVRQVYDQAEQIGIGSLFDSW